MTPPTAPGDASRDTPTAIRVALVEDDPGFQQQIADSLARSAEVELIASAGTVTEGLSMLDRPAADVLLVDLSLPDGSGVEVIARARERWPSCAVMVTTMFADEERVMQSLKAGATGYLLKDALATDIVNEIKTVHAGGSPINPMIARRLLRHFTAAAQAAAAAAAVDQGQRAGATLAMDLSARERQVLEFVIRGYTAQEIAKSMSLSHWTIQTYVRRIYEKMGVRNRAEAVSRAHLMGLVTPPGAPGL